MNLDHLDVSYNNKITDKGIRHMNLYFLCAKSDCFSGYCSISDESIKYLQNLSILDLGGNNKITSKGIKCTNIHTLCVDPVDRHQGRFMEEDIKDMNIDIRDDIKYISPYFSLLLNTYK